MSKLFANKGKGFLLSVLAAILALISLVPYASSAFGVTETFWAVAVVAVVEVLLVLLGTRSTEVLNLAAPLNAVLVLVAMLVSVPSHLDPIGYVVSGLYLIDEIVGFIAFEVLAAISWLLFLAASFLGIVKEKA